MTLGISERSAFATNPTQEGNAAAHALESRGVTVYRMNRGDPAAYIKTPGYIIKAYIKALKDGKTHYTEPRGIQPLREAVARRYKRLYGLDATEEHSVITQGVSEAMSFLNTALIDKGDVAILSRPFYPPYMPYLKIFEGNEIFADYDEDRGWNFDLEGMQKMMRNVKNRKRRIKYMLITNPNNPTGTVLPRKTLEGIADLANEHDFVLVSDEIYDELVFNGAKFTSMCQVAKGIPYIIFNGASKVFDSTGFRLGFALVPEEDRISEGIRRKFTDLANLRLCANAPAQYAFTEALNNAREHKKEIAKLVKEVSGRINFATDIVNGSEFMHAVRPNGAFYIFPKINFGKLRIRDDREFAEKLLNEEHVYITRGSGFGSEGHIRIVALAEKKTLRIAVERIGAFCKRHKR